MGHTISQLTITDIDAVDALMKSNSATLGFLPKVALSEYLERGNVLGARDADNQLVGYLLYGSTKSYFRIAHLCVSEQNRGQGIARRLFNALKKERTTQGRIRLSCRRDFPARKLWPKLGFIPVGEKPGRSAEGHLLTIWHYNLPNTEDQLSLFQARISDDAVDAVIDAQIFFDFNEPDSNKAMPSKALLEDFLVDSLNIWIDDELLVEIDRKADEECRQISIQCSDAYGRINYDKQKSEEIETQLKGILPSRTESEQSDIRHLSNTAASEANIFVTRDTVLLKKSKEIHELTDLEVLSPEELITQIHEISDRKSYTPIRVSGFEIEWRRLTSHDIASFPYGSFLILGERKGKLEEKLKSFFAYPERYECELLYSENKPVFARVLEKEGDEYIVVHFSRVSPSRDCSLFERFAIADTIYRAISDKIPMVKYLKSDETRQLRSNLAAMGFTEIEGGFVRFCFSICMSQAETLSAISELSPNSQSAYQKMTPLDLEMYCSPVSMSANQRHFLIPIKASYAMSLVDRFQSAQDMFGGKPSVLLRWDNVYYRKKSLHNMIKVPARILWYVSGKNQRKVVAVSRLDAVELDRPSALYKKYAGFGILEWEDLYELCDRDVDADIMALKFSHTFTFRNPVALNELRKIFLEEENRNLNVQSPVQMDFSTFERVFQLGFSRGN
ncbi:MAG: GNAT family N-acetyltransferase [Chloroflexi bacterium]|nr:GNAT family N-acetyltransferase [Chloroflexota bacterium]